jgi:hypothetical protein
MKRAFIGVFVLSVLLIGCALYLMQDGRAQLARQDALDARGVQTTGRAEGKYFPRGHANSYHIEYEFALNERTYRNDSRVGWHAYKRAERGQPIMVTYLPDNPDVARAHQSIGRWQGHRALYSSYLMLVIAFAQIPLFYWAMKQQERRKAASAPSPAV